MRILQVIAVMGQGGAERMALQLATDGARHGEPAAIAAVPGDWADRVPDSGAQFYPIPLLRRSPLAVVEGVRALRGAVTRFRPDIVHTHNVVVTAGMRGALTTVRHGPRMLTTFHGTPPENYRRAAMLLRGTTPHIVACSASVGRKLAEAGYPAGRIEVIPNGARMEPATPERIEAARERYGLTAERTVVGVGRLVPQKAWHLLIEAAGSIEGADIVVAGTGELHEELAAQSAARGGRVRFLGPVDDVAAVLACADCFVSTSRWEGLPLTLLEALSLGVPAVSTAVDGVADVITEDAAVLVPPGDPAAVAREVQRVLDDPAHAGQLSAAANLLAADWAPELMIERYRDAYQRLIGR
jgi:glycosyltransferase involved in cell wall biosynthesis